MTSLSSKLKIAIVSIATLAGLAQFGCTGRELGAGLAGAAIGAVIVDSANRDPGYRTCGTDRIYTCDRWPRDYVCGYVYVDRCTGYRYRNVELGSSNASQAINSTAVARTYKLSQANADKLITTLQTAKLAENDAAAAEAFAKIGVNLDEVAALAALGPNGSATPEMIERMAAALGQKPADTKDMVERIASVAREQEALRYKSLNM